MRVGESRRGLDQLESREEGIGTRGETSRAVTEWHAHTHQRKAEGVSPPAVSEHTDQHPAEPLPCAGRPPTIIHTRLQWFPHTHSPTPHTHSHTSQPLTPTSQPLSHTHSHTSHTLTHTSHLLTYTSPTLTTASCVVH